MDEKRIREIIKEELSEIDSRIAKLESWVSACKKHRYMLINAIEKYHSERKEEDLDINLTR